MLTTHASAKLNSGSATRAVLADLASATASRFAIALTTQAKAPDWVMLLPAGRVDTNDGRWFDNAVPDTVVAAFGAGGLQLPFDFEHASEIKAPFGDYAPAAGWIVELANREGAIWGRVEWTDKGRAAIEAKEVKYVSPAFNYDHTSMQVLKLTSAALTVRPAISTLPALTSQQQKDTLMDKKALCAALGLAETASDADILAAVTANKAQAAAQTAAQAALTAAQPSLDKFVPRADFELAVTRAATAESALASRDTEALKAEATALIDQAVKDGKVAPVSRDFYLATCATRKGLDDTKAMLAAAPKIVTTAAKGDDERPGESKALTSEQKQIARATGLSDEDYLKHQAELAKEDA
jgi:phage I-like protein